MLITKGHIRPYLTNDPFLLAFHGKIFTHWSEEWRAPENWLTDIEKHLLNLKASVKRGGEFDQWDFQVKTSLFASSRTLLTIEEHGGGKQYLRLKCWTNFSAKSILLVGLLTILSVLLVLNGQWITGTTIGAFVLFLVARFILESGNCMNSVYAALKLMAEDRQQEKAKVDAMMTGNQPDITEEDQEVVDLQEKYFHTALVQR